ncbi:MAG TPA: lysylphosphatidylglycerol synthase transmembrane domain-containing protein [Candidatus Thermoplasmatota archaeon]|nr:lysylphosphatidylglycerol synthase transmembrane domain-containing protein [Candidatus Thermoplasmatota archaeon]
MSRPRGRLQIIGTSLLGLALLAGLITYVGWGAVYDALRRADGRYLLAALAAYALFFLVRGIRWRILLRPVKREVTVKEATGLTAAGWLVNSFTILKAGDVTRAAVLAKRHRVTFTSVFATVAVERILDLLGIAVLAAAGLMLIPERGLPSWFATALNLAWVIPVAAILVLWVAVTWKQGFLRFTEKVLSFLPGKVQGKLVRFAESCILGAEGLVRSPKAAAQVAPLTLLMSVLQAGVFVCLFLAFLPTPDVAAVAAGVPFFLLSFGLPVTPGNVGTYEVAFAAIYVALGFTAEQVAPVAILTHLGTSVIVALLGAAALVHLGIDFTRLKEERDVAHETPTAPAPASQPQEVAP